MYNYKKFIIAPFRRLVGRLGYTIIKIQIVQPTLPESFLYEILNIFLKINQNQNKKFNIVQVGANDGITGDPV
jgi:hypothetical protein|tara:strand:+ start:107 stop:325 length:219 start_codon:yes stop_codon:yes gene_type:complete